MTVCTCGKNCYGNKWEAVKQLGYRRRNEKSSRTKNMEAYFCPQGHAWHLGHRIGYKRRLT